MDNDLVTIVVPIYNVEKYLKRCIDSIINQTYKNIEIILVDDGSTDSSGKIADEYAKKDDRIKVFHKKNGGLSDARNYGIEVAKGKYICFFDSDDYVNNDIIYELYKLIKKKNYYISIINFKKFYNEKELIDLENKKVKNYTKEEAINELFKEDGFGNYAWNKMYDISLFNDVRYPLNKKVEDLGTTYKLILKCDNILFSYNKYYYYFQRDNSILHTFDKKLYMDKLEQAIDRYYEIKRIYPNNIYNKIFIFNVIIDCIPYIERKCKIFNICNKIINTEIPYNVKKKISFKKKIKYFIYKINFNLFIRMFGGK